MPGIDGPEICRRLRAQPGATYVYVLIVTARTGRDDLVAGLDAGADDFLVKPIDPAELAARLRVGQRTVGLETELRGARSYLEAVLARIDSGILLADADDRVLFANPPLEQLLGEEGLRGRPRHELLGRLGAVASDPPADLVVERRPGDRRIFRWSTRVVPLPGRDGRIDSFRDVTREVELTEALRQEAVIDHATGLLNRRGGEDALARELARARRHRSPLSLAVLDLDHFKRVNDEHGHAVGDSVLRVAAARVLQAIRITDAAVRWGGEEFVVILPDAVLAAARTVVDRIRIAVGQPAEERLPVITMSAGVAELKPEDESWAVVLDRADERLYEAKASGRNCVR